MVICPACREFVSQRTYHYVSAVGHLTEPEGAITPYWRCTGESAAAVAHKTRGLCPLCYHVARYCRCDEP